MADGTGDRTAKAPDAEVSGENNVTWKLALEKYPPYVAAGSAACFGANYMSPLILERPFGSYSLIAQNFCFGLAHIGTGICIYNRIPKDQHAKAILISATGSVLFNYGTLLVLANVKHYLPKSQLLRCVVGLGVVGYLFWVGKEYCDYMNSEQSQVD